MCGIRISAVIASLILVFAWGCVRMGGLACACVRVCVCVHACSVYLQITYTRESPVTSYEMTWKFNDIATFSWFSSVRKFRLTYSYVHRS
jgi:hypothetical protein